MARGRWMGTDELIVIDLPPGPEWVGLVTRLWLDEVPFLPLDHRLTERERGAIVDRARPHFVRDAAGDTLLADAAPVTPGVAIVMPTSGTGGEPKLVELHRVAAVVAISRSAQRLGATPDARWLCPLTPAHIGGLLVLLRGRDPRRSRDDPRAVRSRTPRPRRGGCRVRVCGADDGSSTGGVEPRIGGPHAAGRRRCDRRRHGGRRAAARRPPRHQLWPHGDVRWVHLRRRSARGDAGQAGRGRRDRGLRVHGDGELPARPGRNGGGVHDGRVAAHRRPGRDRRRRAGSRSTGGPTT